MQFGFGARIRHPLFPGLIPTPAREAKAVSCALHGTFPELVHAACEGAQATRAVFVILRVDEAPLSEQDRDLLWDLFQVPAFLLMLDGKDRVLGYECEVQNGLHVTARFPSDSAAAAECECGRPGQKLFLAAETTAHRA